MTRELGAAVRAATARLADAGVPSPEADAVALAAHVLGTSAAEVRKAMVLGRAAPDGYETLVDERARRVPLQHLTGRAGFRGIELRVGPGVFTPRPETELVAGLAVEAARVVAAGGASPVVVDLCTGSGAIALAVKDEVPGAQVHAVELSPDAYAWALANRDALALDVDVRLGDATEAFDDLLGAVDVVVSNPPYIPAGMEPVDPEVRDHDPGVALYGGDPTGLAIPLVVAARAARLLRAGGRLLMEHADTQGGTLPARLRATGQWRDVVDHVDLNGRPRATSAVRSTARSAEEPA
ncbi:putative methylase [Nostocoides japonicum T1-X7]|uniref:Release factor glutamine methyltransferase n=1 Tax=Nostocoides japonicum T1-X7 TaxID=1194083 RepID=A0A077LWC5_9MICO|nr:peptide chain release factor N(5)-glutamine methyltransferase [Tetrasphaera japonica]CCH76215.1 putative methylase [Tetrasphaera japonica T1-X7]